MPRMPARAHIVLHALVVLAAAGPAAAAIEVVAGPPLAPEAVAAMVRHELQAAEEVPHHRIDVALEDGLVVLRGQVPHALARERAELLAGLVRGTGGVRNLLAIDAPGVTVDDEDLAAAIGEALAAHPAIDADALRVAVDDGVAVLAGAIPSERSRELARIVAGSVEGVRAVRDRTRMIADVLRSDERLALEIEAGLRWNPRLDAERIEVAVRDRVAALRGTVGSVYARHLAELEAWVLGVRAVDGEALEVDWRIRDPRLQEPDGLDHDRLIAEAVRDELARDPLLAEADLRVGATAGIVALAGTVPTLRARRHALWRADAVPGVWRVEADELRVEPPEAASDDEVAAAIRSAFGAHALLDEEPIEVLVEDGAAVLSGTVRSEFLRDEATAIVEALPGVVELRNLLLVALAGEPPADDP